MTRTEIIYLVIVVIVAAGAGWALAMCAKAMS
jgi:hypothetical protein